MLHLHAAFGRNATVTAGWIRRQSEGRPHQALGHLSPHRYRAWQLQAVAGDGGSTTHGPRFADKPMSGSSQACLAVTGRLGSIMSAGFLRSSTELTLVGVEPR